MPDDYYSEYIRDPETHEGYLVHSMYGEDPGETLVIQQPIESLLEAQELVIARSLEGGKE